MKKTETITQTREVFYCDKCGKRLSKKEFGHFSPWACLHYLRKYTKFEEEHDSFSINLDLCDECNVEVSERVLEEWYKFKQKCEEFKKKGDK